MGNLAIFCFEIRTKNTNFAQRIRTATQWQIKDLSVSKKALAKQ